MAKKHKLHVPLSYISVAEAFFDDTTFTGHEVYERLIGLGYDVSLVTVSRKLSELAYRMALSKSASKPIVYTIVPGHLDLIYDLQAEADLKISAAGSNAPLVTWRPGALVGKPGTSVYCHA